MLYVQLRDKNTTDGTENKKLFQIKFLLKNKKTKTKSKFFFICGGDTGNTNSFYLHQ